MLPLHVLLSHFAFPPGDFAGGIPFGLTPVTSVTGSE